MEDRIDQQEQQSMPEEIMEGGGQEAQEIASREPAMEESEEPLEESEEELPEEVPRRPRTDSNTIYIGKKGTMGYVLAVVTQFNNGAAEVIVKARGKLISRAVDVAEIVRHRFLPNSKVSDISISTEELTSEDGSKNKVSAIEIKIQK